VRLGDAAAARDAMRQIIDEAADAMREQLAE
jgi:DNA-binding FadR family transcriptional regulator